MTTTAYILRQPVTGKRPTRWDIHARYAMRLPDEIVDLPPGTWLLALPEPGDNGSHSPHPPHYRLADGRVVCLDAPLTSCQADPLTDPQALTALTAYRSLEQAVEEDWGLQVEHVDRNAPFRLIQCPLCDGTTFVSVGFSGVWCDRCQAEFRVRHTAGDPGFVVDCTWAHYQPAAARYLLPRSDELVLTMVCKNGGPSTSSGQAPHDLTHSQHCYGDCTPEQIALTSGRDSAIRAGLHACVLGDVYNWSFYGQVPTVYSYEWHGHHTLLWPDGREEAWPRSAFVTVSGFSWEDKQKAVGAAALLATCTPAGYGANFGSLRYRDELAAFLNEWAAQPSQPPSVAHRGVWPRRSQLQDGERYLLHRWLVQREKEDWVTAAPVWLVVRDAAREKYAQRWAVVRDNICPQCGRSASQEEWASQVNEKRPWDTPHGYCRALWTRHNWRPTLFGE
ncbi:MAG: hypothetical protein R3E31_02600 [Chloroflexota bacterium]